MCQFPVGCLHAVIVVQIAGAPHLHPSPSPAFHPPTMLALPTYCIVSNIAEFSSEQKSQLVTKPEGEIENSCTLLQPNFTANARGSKD